VKLVHLVGFIIKKFVMMHGHMNVKNFEVMSHKFNIHRICFYVTFSSQK